LIKKSFLDLKRDVIDAGLCTRCGSCVGVCKVGCIQFTDPLGACLPEQIGACTSCGLCYTGCSGKEVLWPALNQQVFGKQPDNYLLGNFQEAFVGFSTDPEVRRGAGSGGIVSAISLYLLENKLVNGIVSLTDDVQQPYRAVPQVLTDRGSVLRAAQSKYSISPVNTILHRLINLEGHYAYVGLPCQIHSLRKLQKARHPAARKIKYVIGLYCGNILHFDSVRSYLARNGVRDLDQVTSLKYRAGEWPGKMEIKLQNGRIFSIKKFYANYLIPFYIMRRCLLCTDLTNEFADLSVGDGWAPVYEERGKGWSVILGRTPQGTSLLREMESKKHIELFPISEDAAINMHSHGLDLKKTGAFLRIKFRQWQKSPVPSFGYTLESASFFRQLEELAQVLVFWICSWKFSRWLVNLIPLGIIGGLFQLLRTLWMRNTHSKDHKSGIASARFRLTE
jgi:coenzyme F420 hydrogenase subunit beta